MTRPDTDLGSTPQQRWMAVARLLRPQGRRGEVLAEPLTDLTEVFAAHKRFRLAKDEAGLAAAPLVTLEESWLPQGRNAGRIVFKLSGVDTISAAEGLQGQFLFLPESELPALESDTYLVRDLAGCELFDSERRLGLITDLQFPVGPDGRTRLEDAADLLVVQREGTPDEDGSVLVPFVKAWLISIDLEGKRIVMQLPAGLLDESS